MVQKGLTSHSTQYRPFRGWSYQPVTWRVLTKTKYNYNQKKTTEHAIVNTTENYVYDTVYQNK